MQIVYHFRTGLAGSPMAFKFAYEDKFVKVSSFEID